MDSQSQVLEKLGGSRPLTSKFSSGFKDDDTSILQPQGKLKLGDIGNETNKGPKAKKLWLTTGDRDEVLEENLDENEQQVVIRHFLASNPETRKDAEVRTLVLFFKESPQFEEFSDVQLEEIFRSATLTKYRKGRAIPVNPRKGILVLEGVVYCHRKEAIVRKVKRESLINQNQSLKSKKQKEALQRASEDGIQNMGQFLTDLREEVPDEAIVDDVGRAMDWLDDMMTVALQRKSTEVRLRKDAEQYNDGMVITVDPWVRVQSRGSMVMARKEKHYTAMMECLLFDARESQWMGFVPQTYTTIVEFDIPKQELESCKLDNVTTFTYTLKARGNAALGRAALGTMGNAVATLLTEELKRPTPDPVNSLLGMVVGRDLATVLLRLPEKDGQQVAGLLKPMTFAKGSTIHEQGTTLKECIFLRSGEVRVRFRMARGTNFETIEIGAVRGGSDDSVPSWLGAVSCREGRPETFWYTVSHDAEAEGLAIPARLMRDITKGIIGYNLEQTFWQSLTAREKGWSGVIKDELEKIHHAVPGSGFRYAIPRHAQQACMVDLGQCPTWVLPPSAAAAKREDKNRREKIDHRNRVLRSVGLEGGSRCINIASLCESHSVPGEDASKGEDGAESKERTDSVHGSASIGEAYSDRKGTEESVHGSGSIGETCSQEHAHEESLSQPSATVTSQQIPAPPATSASNAIVALMMKKNQEKSNSRPSSAKPEKSSPTGSTSSRPSSAKQKKAATEPLSPKRAKDRPTSARWGGRQRLETRARLESNDSDLGADDGVNTNTMNDWLFAGAEKSEVAVTDSDGSCLRCANLHADLAGMAIFDPSLVPEAGETSIGKGDVLLKPMLFPDQQDNEPLSTRSKHGSSPWSRFGDGDFDSGPPDSGSPSSPRFAGPRKTIVSLDFPSESSPSSRSRNSLKGVTHAFIAANRLSRVTEGGRKTEASQKTVRTTEVATEASRKTVGITEVAPSHARASGEHVSGNGSKASSKEDSKAKSQDNAESSPANSKLSTKALMQRLSKGVNKVILANKLKVTGDINYNALSKDRDQRWQEREAVIEAHIVPQEPPAMILSDKGLGDKAAEAVEYMSPARPDSTIRRMKNLHEQIRKNNAEEKDEVDVTIVADSPLVIQNRGGVLGEQHAEDSHIGDHTAIMPSTAHVIRTLEKGAMGFCAPPQVSPSGPATSRPRTASFSKTSRPNTARSNQHGKISRPNTAPRSHVNNKARNARQATPERNTPEMILVAPLKERELLLYGTRQLLEDSAQQTPMSPLSHLSPNFGGQALSKPSMEAPDLHGQSTTSAEVIGFDGQDNSVIYMVDGTPLDGTTPYGTRPGTPVTGKGIENLLVVKGVSRLVRPAQSRPPSASKKSGPPSANI